MVDGNKPLRIAHIATMREHVFSGPRNSVTLLSSYLNQLHGVESKVFTNKEIAVFMYNHERVTPLLNEEQLKTFDCVVFSGFFNIQHVKIARLLKRWGVPYVIAPRSSLMKRSYTRSGLKKGAFMTLGGLRYVREARAIQFLTGDEQLNSFMWNKSHFISGNIVSHDVLNKSVPSHSDSRRVGFMGRYDVNHKGLDLLLEAIGESKQSLRTHGVSFALVGPDYRGGKAILSDLIKKYDIADLVTMGEAVSGDNKTKFLADLSAFIHTSRYEGQPQAVMEAMAQGLPVIVSNGTNMQSIVREGECGICLGDDDRFADALSTFAAQQPKLAVWSDAAKTYAVKHFNGVNVAEHFVEQIKRVI